MAGNANLIDRPYPNGPEILVWQTGNVAIEASKTDHVWDVTYVQYAFYPTKVEICSQTVAITNAITIDLADNEGTPNVIMNNEALAAVTAGASTAPIQATIDDRGLVLQGAVLIARYTSGASDTSVGTRMRLWGCPLNA
jgi:hypothetical protein